MKKGSVKFLKYIKIKPTGASASIVIFPHPKIKNMNVFVRSLGNIVFML